MSVSTNTTSMPISTDEQFSLSSYYAGLIKRLLIVFGSISFVWFIMGLIFASIQTIRHIKRRNNQKLFFYHRSIPSSAPPKSSLPSKEQTVKQDHVSDDEDDEDDDQVSVYTSVSFISERSKIPHEHTHIVSLCESIPEEEFELKLTAPMGVSNMAFSQSTLTSLNDGESSSLNYPAFRNCAYSQSTLSSSNTNLNTSIPPTILPIHESSITKSLSNRISNLKRNSSQSSTTTTFSQITNATYLSSNSSTSTSSSVRLASIKTMPLPTVMITDCDRLQTDIIELEEFEPEKDWRRARPELRLLLNDRMPQAVR